MAVVHPIEAISTDEIVALTQALISIESHVESPSRESAVADYICRYLKAEGIESQTERVEGVMSNVYGFFGDLAGDNPVFLLEGHLDTVPALGMSATAFVPAVRNGLLHGRGAADMKGGLAAMIACLVALKRTGTRIRGGVMFAGVAGEELPSGCQGVRALLRRNLKANYAVVGEPTGNRIAIAHKGLSIVNVSIEGKEAHGSTPWLGHNAILMMSRFIERLRTEILPWLEDAPSPIPRIGHATINVGTLGGGRHPSLVPAECRLSMDCRLLPGQEYKDLERRLVAILDSLTTEEPGFTFSVTRSPGTSGRDPMILDSQCPLVQAASAACRQLRLDPDPTSVPFWTEAALLAQAGIPALVLGPGEAATAHSDMEYISVDEVVQAFRLYCLTTLNLLTTET
jgi:acetylornithine deacetylase/succinyl-diaminopimelate desuccinylase-like protein